MPILSPGKPSACHVVLLDKDKIMYCRQLGRMNSLVVNVLYSISHHRPELLSEML